MNKSACYIFKILILVLLIQYLNATIVFAQNRVNFGKNIEIPRSSHPNCIKINDTIACFEILYDTITINPVYVAYKLTKSNIKGDIKRSNSFHSDPRLVKQKLPRATNSDYKDSGYDRGHLLPSADRKQNEQQNRATFSLANCSPQTPKLNRHTWRLLEENVRHTAQSADTLYIVTGAIINQENRTQKIGKVTIPDSFFKTILILKDGKFTARAYLMPNLFEPNSDFKTYRTSIKEIEYLTNLDLYHFLPDHIEKSIETM